MKELLSPIVIENNKKIFFTSLKVIAVLYVLTGSMALTRLILDTFL